jgi:hypothetical protein
MDLYTSLTHLKREMNGGVLPQMTPLTTRALKYLDPEFTIGMGALKEDPELGLQCPVRGCGGWYHNLTRHLNTARDETHRQLGGAGLKRLLDIPPTAKLSSTVHRKACSERLKRRGRIDRLPIAKQRQRPKKAARTYVRTMRSTGYRNFANQCEAQLAHKLVDLQHKVGRSPTTADVRRELGRGVYEAILKVFGTLNVAKASVNLRIRKQGSHCESLNEDDILAMFGEYYRGNGCLPRSYELKMPQRPPLLPGRDTVARIMKTKSHSQAMRRIATLLGIDDGRYGSGAGGGASERVRRQVRVA